jgi:hypothetical protein
MSEKRLPELQRTILSREHERLRSVLDGLDQDG